MRLSNPGRLGRDLFGCYLLAWVLFVLPMIFYLAVGRAGFWEALKEWFRLAASGDKFALMTFLATPPILYLPFWIYRMRRTPGEDLRS